MAGCRKLAVGTGLIIVTAAVWTVLGGESGLINWNELAPGKVLSRESLKGLAPIVPSWKIQEMVWPSESDLRAKRCEVPELLRSYCMQWLAKYLNPTQVPPHLESHLVALREWETYGGEDPERKADVFLVRFQKGPQTIQIQEGLADVIIVVADERLLARRRSDHAQFVAEVSASLLKEPLRPIPGSSKFHVASLGAGGDGTQISRVSWLIESVLVRDADGKEAISQPKAAEVGTFSVAAETDGRFVRFELRKMTEAPGIDAFARRFAPDTK